MENDNVDAMNMDVCRELLCNFMKDKLGKTIGMDVWVWTQGYE